CAGEGARSGQQTCPDSTVGRTHIAVPAGSALDAAPARPPHSPPSESYISDSPARSPAGTGPAHKKQQPRTPRTAKPAGASGNRNGNIDTPSIHKAGIKFNFHWILQLISRRQRI